MNAAKTSSTEAVAILLRGHADPDIVDEEGWTALSYALKTNNVDIIERLAPITIVGIDTSISLLARTRLRMERGLEFSEVIESFFFDESESEYYSYNRKFSNPNPNIIRDFKKIRIYSNL